MLGFDNTYNLGELHVVSNTNRFVYAYSEQSQAGPIRGRGLCEQIAICVITATGMRHRVSTAFWRMDIFDTPLAVIRQPAKGGSAEYQQDKRI